MTSDAAPPIDRPLWQRRIRGFDGLRAAAIVLVILWHTRLMLGFESVGWLDGLVGVGWSGVDLFFGLSGFLITSLLLDEERSAERIAGVRRFSMKDFYARRLLRIFPPYYTVLLVTLLVLSRFVFFPSAAWPWGTHPPLLYVASLLFLFSNFLDLGDIGFAYIVNWSLCVEEHFYLLWPATLRIVRAPAARVLLGLTVCLLVPLLRMQAIAAGLPSHRVHTMSHLRIDSILWGAVAALLFPWLASRVVLRRGLLAGAAAAALFFVVSGHLSFEPRPSAFGHVVGLTALAVAVAAFVTDVAATPASRLVSLLETLPLRAIGKVSYGMYLLHFQAIDAVRLLAPRALLEPHTPLTFLLLSAIVTALTFAAAALMYRMVERPALRLKRHFGGTGQR